MALDTLGIFMFKAPALGRVKTRLAREIGEARALELYRWLGRRQWEAAPEEWSREVRHAPDGAAAELRRWLGGEAVRCRPQGEGDLGRRMERACAEAFAAGAGQVVLLGADCPSLDAAALRALAGAMEGGDGAVVPARDGGYCALGLWRPAPELFRGIEWGGPSVLEGSLARAREAGIDLAVTEEREDVDDLASLRRCVARHPELKWPAWARALA